MLLGCLSFGGGGLKDYNIFYLYLEEEENSLGGWGARTDLLLFTVYGD